MAKKPKDGDGGERLKIPMDWESAAEKLLRTPPRSAPPRTVKPRAKKADKPKQ